MKYQIRSFKLRGATWKTWKDPFFRKCNKCGDTIAIKTPFLLIRGKATVNTKYHLSCVERYPYLIDWDQELWEKITGKKEYLGQPKHLLKVKSYNVKT